MIADGGWSRRSFLGSVAAAVAGGDVRAGNLLPSTAGALARDAAAPPPLTGARELFVDDERIAEMHGLERRLHRFVKHPGNPIVVADRPWEGIGVFLYGTVLRDADEGVWKMWYRAGTRSRKDYAAGTNVCYALSDDGIRWTKPALGIHDHYGYARTNIVFRPPAGGKSRFDSLAVFKDSVDADPGRRYKMVTFQYNDEHYYAVDKPRPSGCYAAFSADGLRWREEADQPFLLIGNGMGDTLNLMHDTRRNRYVIFTKIFVTPEGRFIYRDAGSQQRIRRADGGFDSPEHPVTLVRHRGQAESTDMLHWTEPVWIVPKDDRDPADVQFYNNTGFLYGSQYLGLLAVYHPDTTGSIDVQLISSRDGRNWRRAFDRSPILACGEPDGEWDFGPIATSSEPPQRVGDELRVYYGSGWGRHSGTGPDVPARDGQSGRAIGMAKLRLDGFVSLETGAEPGTLTTVPLLLEQPGIRVNAEVRGAATVEVLDAAGLPVAELSGPAAGRIAGNGTALPVRFDRPEALRAWVGRPVRLRFTLRDASLYSFWSGPHV